MFKITAPRHQPVQRRSQERLERILQVAAQLIGNAGSESVRMAEVAAQSGISIGTLYRYFPDKTTLIASLAQHFYTKGHVCVQAALVPVQTEQNLNAALRQIVQEYYQLYCDEPALRNIWGATQSDQLLQELDAQDLRVHAQLLLDCLGRVYPKRNPEALATTALLTMHLINATVRLAVTLPSDQAQALLDLFKAHEFTQPDMDAAIGRYG